VVDFDGLAMPVQTGGARPVSRTPVTLHVFKCDRCDALVVGRELPRIVTVHSADHLLCIECADHLVTLGAEQRAPEPRDVAPSGPFFAVPLTQIEE
jgi:hypothetical protein